MFNAYTKCVSNMRPELASLPSTEGAAMQRSYRVFHQIHLGHENELSPEFSDWKSKIDHNLVPITTTDTVAPEIVPNLIFCQYITGCGHKCECRKTGITCTAACHYCHGDCSNSSSTVEEDVLMGDGM